MIKFYKILVIVITLTLCGIIFTQSEIIKPSKPIYTPARSIAAMGDSITKAANACEAWQECDEASWSTGTLGEINSVASQVEKIPNPEAKHNEKAEVKRFNNAKSYSKSNDLINQATITLTQRPELITILTGANDICTPSLGEMTSTEEYSSNVEQTLIFLNENLPKSKIIIGSVPNIYTLWEQGKDNEIAVEKWNSASLCPTMLKNPTSMHFDDEKRRQSALTRIKEYNDSLQKLCSRMENCKFDDNRIFESEFTVEDISEVDYFHPSLLGQRKIAEAIWDSEMQYYAKFNRGTSKRSSLDAPIVTVIHPEEGEVLSGSKYVAKVQIESEYPIDRVYADTQIGGVDLSYNKTENYWYLELDTTLAPNGLKTYFSIVAVDEKQGVSISDSINVTVDNTDYSKSVPGVAYDPTVITQTPSVISDTSE